MSERGFEKRCGCGSDLLDGVYWSWNAPSRPNPAPRTGSSSCAAGRLVKEIFLPTPERPKEGPTVRRSVFGDDGAGVWQTDMPREGEALIVGSLREGRTAGEGVGRERRSSGA